MNKSAALALNVSTCKTSQLVAAYNLLAGKSIKKFETRAIAEARVGALLATAQAASSRWKCPGCGADEFSSHITAAALEGQPGADRLFCHHCSTEFFSNGRVYKAPAASATRRGAIAASWQRPAVAAARGARHAVRVTRVRVEGGAPTRVTEQFKSVREAFAKLGLPMGRHIKFRGQLKAAGKLRFADNVTFTLVDSADQL